MIDLHALVDLVVLALARGSQTAGSKAAEITAERGTNALLDRLKRRLKSTDSTKSLAQLASSSSDAKAQQRFRDELRSQLAADDALAGEIRRWARDCGTSVRGDQTATLTGSGRIVQIQGSGNSV